MSAEPEGPAQPAGSVQSRSGDDYSSLTDAVRELVKVMRDGAIGRLEVRRGDLRISLESIASGATTSYAPPPVVTANGPVEAAPPPAEERSGYVISSPMIGMFYTAPGPGEPPFVQVGDEVTAGQTVAIIEAMKIMNEIVSERAGVVEEIFVANGEAVEYGHPLMRLREQG